MCLAQTNNTNWITQLENTQEIKNVSYEQIEDEVFRITIELEACSTGAILSITSGKYRW